MSRSRDRWEAYALAYSISMLPDRFSTRPATECDKKKAHDVSAANALDR
jgi:hypothetical protein